MAAYRILQHSDLGGLFVIITRDTRSALGLRGAEAALSAM
jgi:hypothetical protein